MALNLKDQAHRDKSTCLKQRKTQNNRQYNRFTDYPDSKISDTD